MFRQFGMLSRFILRRDRVRIPLWVASILFFTLLVPLALSDLFPSQEERNVMAETMANPAMIAMAGPTQIDNYTLGVMTAHNMLLFTAIAVGIMSIFLFIRHTRADEENGSSELILALPVGRLAHLNAASAVVVLTNIILAILASIGLYALQLESMDLQGSLVYGASLGAIGIFFTSVAAIFVQISSTARGAIGISLGFLIVAYLLRAVGDVSNETLSLFSPLGLVTKTEAYWNNYWWPIIVLLGFSVVLFLIANYLHAIRDWGSAFIHAKAGRKSASPFLRSPLALSLRMQRTSFISWTIGMLVLGMSYGSVMGDLEAFFQGNELLNELLIAEEGYTLTEQFLPLLLLIMAMLASIPSILAITKLASEEKKGRLELLLSLPVSRTRLMGSYVAIALVNGFIMLSLTTLGLWAAADMVMEDPISFRTLYGAGLVYYPAILLMIGLSVFLIGFLPRFVNLIWFYLIIAFFINYLGGLLQFPDWVGYLSPFGHIPGLPVESMDWAPVIYLSGIAVFLMMFGMLGFRKRDII